VAVVRDQQVTDDVQSAVRQALDEIRAALLDDMPPRPDATN
jgi:hypothetical protein